VRTIQSWASGGVEVKTDPNEIGVMTIGMGVAGLTDAMTWIQDIVVTGGGMIGTTEVGTGETVGQGPGPPEGGRDPRIGTTEDGDGPMKG